MAPGSSSSQAGQSVFSLFTLSECLRIRSELTPRLEPEGCSLGLTALPVLEGSSEGARTSPQMPTQL